MAQMKRKYPPNPQKTMEGEKHERIRTWILANCKTERERTEAR